jgi:hypothetical protein
MARPIKNNMDYFSHDNKMRNDRKIKALRAKFGLQGYAVFNMFLELLCEAELLVIEWNEMERELISGDFGLPASELDEITNYLIHIDLLQRSNGWLYCENLDKRSDNVFDKRTRDLDSLRSENGINVSETPVSVPESTQSIVKDSKVEESIKKSKFIAPQINEVIEYFIENGYTPEAGKKAFNYYSTAAWKDASGKPVKNWKQKMIAVWFKPENEKKEEKRVSKYQNTQMP